MLLAVNQLRVGVKMVQKAPKCSLLRQPILFLSVLITLVFLASFASASYELDWQVHYLKFGADAIVDAAGNVYFAGGEYDPNVLSDRKFIVSKYDKDGRELWKRQIECPDNDFGWCRGITLGPDGYVYVTGEMEVIRDTEIVSVPTTVKYDKDGKQLWVAQYNITDKNTCFDPVAIAVDGKGEVYVTGKYRMNDYRCCTPASDDDDPNVRDEPEDLNDLDLYLERVGDFMTIKYDTNGSQLWAVRYTTRGEHVHEPSDICIDKKGYVYVTGRIDSNGWDVNEVPYSCFAVVKYNSAGKKLWLAKYPERPDNRFSVNHGAKASALDDRGNIYITGSVVVYKDDSPNTNPVFRFAVLSREFITVKYNPGGQEQWRARYHVPEKKWGYPSSIKLDGSGNVYVAGYIYFEEERYITSLGDSTYNKGDFIANKGDFIVIKYNANGKERWRARYKGPEGHRLQPDCLIVDGSSNIYVIGSIKNRWWDSDVIIIKYDNDGNEKFVKRIKDISQMAKILSAISRP